MISKYVFLYLIFYRQICALYIYPEVDVIIIFKSAEKCDIGDMYVLYCLNFTYIGVFLSIWRAIKELQLV